MPVPENHIPGAVITAADINALAALANDAQPGSPDLTAIAAVDSTTAGVLVTDGSGWIRKTYAQLKTALALVKGDVGLGNVDNTSDVNKPVSTATTAAISAASAAEVTRATGAYPAARIVDQAGNPVTLNTKRIVVTLDANGEIDDITIETAA